MSNDPEARLFYLDRIELSHKHDTKHQEWHHAPFNSITLPDYLQKYNDLYLDAQRLESLRHYVSLVTQLRFASEEGRAILLKSAIFSKVTYLFNKYISMFIIYL